MPYGIPKEKGGDSLENVAKMEPVVGALRRKGRSESSAIAIAKSTLGFTKGRRRRAGK